MRIGLLQPATGSDPLLDDLEHALRNRGHQISSVPAPLLGDDPETRLNAYEQCLSLDVDGVDAVVSSSSPGWLVDHECCIVLTGADDLPPIDQGWVDPFLARPEDLHDPMTVLAAARDYLAEGNAPGRSVMAWLDRHLASLSLRRAALVATPSEFAARRIDPLLDRQPIMVTPPTPRTAEAGLRVPPRMICVTESSFDGFDHIDNVIRGFCSTGDPRAELRVLGDGPDRAAIERAVEDRRVHFLGPVRAEARRAELRAASSVLIASRNRGWSFIGIEAMAAGTPLVAAEDAGGIVEIVEHGVNGVVVPATADGFGWGARHVASTPRLRWQLGLQAMRRAAGLEWSPFLDAIDDLPNRGTRPSALTLSTYPIEPMVGGGQRRARHLHRSLSLRADVTVLVNSSPTNTIRRRLVEPGLAQFEVPKSDAQREAELDIYHAMDRLPVDDITAAALSPATPAFAAELTTCVESADLIIATQPFLLPCLPHESPPIVHDSQNVEALLKADLLPDTAGGRWLQGIVEDSEREASERATVVTACTDSDLDRLVASGGTSAIGMVIGNGVDTNALVQRTPDEHHAARAELLAVSGLPANDERPIGLFIGSWHPPNIDAARLILDLATARPDWVFILAGSHTSEFADDTIPTNVHTIAIFAESMLWPLLAGADVALNPMRSGGGSNLKLFDYLAVGTPIVTTLTGARGLQDPESVAIVSDADVAAFSAAIDRAVSDLDSSAGQARIQRGRTLVENDFDWSVLGDRWSTGILDAVGVEPGQIRRRSRTSSSPIVSPIEAPSTDPIVATIQLLGQQARTIAPTAQGASMDPALREHIKRADDNRKIGRELPSNARFATPKRALIRVGRAFTNEQVIYNEAMLHAVEQLAVTVENLENEQRALKTALAAVEAENQALRQQLTGDEGGE